MSENDVVKQSGLVGTCGECSFEKGRGALLDNFRINGFKS